MLRRIVETAFRKGDFAEAEAACRKLIRKAPNDSFANYVLANLATDAGHHRKAVAFALAAATDLRGQGLEHASAVSLKLISVGEYGAAFRVLRTLDLYKPGAGPLLPGIARQFSILEQHQMSLDCLEQARSFAAGDEKLHFLIGNANKFNGDIEAAARHYEHCIAINPNFSYAHWALAYLGRKYNSPSHVDRIRAVLANVHLPTAERINCEYALFKELDCVGDFDQAWAALSRGSRLKNGLVSYDGAAESSIFDGLMQKYGASPDPEPTSSGLRPLFIVGMPRTGTTLLERILGNNPELAICGELNDFRMQFKWCTDHYCTGFLDVESIQRLQAVHHDELGQRYLEHVRWRLGSSTTFTDKNPGNFMMVGAILAALPEARILHLTRDPMDACFSNLKELFAANSHPYSYSLENLSTHYLNYSRLMSHWRRLAPARILDVSYELLVSDPTAVARGVMDFCGLEFNADQVNIESSGRPVSTASSAQVREPIHSRNIGAWRNYAGQLSGLSERLGSQQAGQ